MEIIPFRKIFKFLKQYLTSPPILMSPTPGKPLLLYISVTQFAIGALLSQYDLDHKERAIYYLIRTLITYELNYLQI